MELSCAISCRPHVGSAKGARALGGEGVADVMANVGALVRRGAASLGTPSYVATDGTSL